MRFTRSKVAATAAVASALVVPFVAMPAANAAAPLHVSKVLSSSLVGPLQFTVSGSQVLVADSFTNTLTKLGVPTPIASFTPDGPDSDLAGVAYDRDQHSIAYATSNASHSSTVLRILRPGHAPVTADISGFEALHNPDNAIHYGIDAPTPCQAAALGPDVGYDGRVDSHPYAVTALGRAAWAVADAGGNDILKVDQYGHVSLLALVPPSAVTITAAFAAASGLPDCVVGAVYKFESVPTDVERGPDGALFISSLPGGPEGPGSGNPGSVYKLAENGVVSQVATGFAGATNLAVDSHGNVFVAEIGSGTIAEVVAGHPSPVLSLPGVVAVEFANGHLYASTAPAVTGGSEPGTIVKLSS